MNNSEATERVLALALDLSRSWRHFYLGIEHLFAAVCRQDNSVASCLSGAGVSISELEEGILSLVPPGDESPLWDGTPETPRCRRLMKSLVNEEAEAMRAIRIEPKHIVMAALREGRSVPCRFLQMRSVDLLLLRDAIKGGSPSAMPSASSSSPAVSSQPVSSSSSKQVSSKNNKKSPLLQYGRDLVDLARQGKIDPVVGRNDEVRRVLQTLTRKTKSNPVLVGEAGVGKTAVAYGLALRIAAGTVPDSLKDKRLIELSLSSLVAGTGHRGEFEKRLQNIMDELAKDPSIILFIDEIHQIVGAGSAGGMDAGNILKPALARGDFAVMGATTTDEYRRYIEADPALERRFQQIMVSEPSEEDAFEILKGLRGRYEQHHGVHFPDETLLAAVKLSVRFLPDRNLPDKAIDLIDEAAARVKTRAAGTQAGVQPGTQNFEISEEVIAEVVADWTGIPISRIANEEEARLLDMENLLRGRVVGQDHAVAAVASTIRVVRVGLSSPNRPSGVFLFLGPSGVGKTELAKTLAEFLFGSEREMVRLDMSEFHDKHSVARLIGAPPGYVGYEGEGQLTKAVRTKPFCVLLLDEVEKAHPDIFDIFLQVFDEGRLTDAKGRTVNFTNAIIIMTSNLGARKAIEASEAAEMQAGAASDGAPLRAARGGIVAPPTDQGFVGQIDDLPQAYQAALRGHFRPEFLNRIDEIVVFRTLKREDLRGIVDLNLDKSIKRIKENRQVDVSIDESAISLILDKGYHPEFGARPLNRAIDTWLTRPFAEYLLRNKVMPGTLVRVTRDGDKLVFIPQSRGHLGDTMGGNDEPPMLNANFGGSTSGAGSNYQSGQYGQPNGQPSPVQFGAQPEQYGQPSNFNQPSGAPSWGAPQQPAQYNQLGAPGWGASQQPGVPQQPVSPRQAAVPQPTGAQYCQPGGSPNWNQPSQPSGQYRQPAPPEQNMPSSGGSPNWGNPSQPPVQYRQPSQLGMASGSPSWGTPSGNSSAEQSGGQQSRGQYQPNGQPNWGATGGNAPSGQFERQPGFNQPQGNFQQNQFGRESRGFNGSNSQMGGSYGSQGQYGTQGSSRPHSVSSSSRPPAPQGQFNAPSFSNGQNVSNYASSSEQGNNAVTPRSEPLAQGYKNRIRGPEGGFVNRYPSQGSGSSNPQSSSSLGNTFGNMPPGGGNVQNPFGSNFNGR